MIKSFFKSFNIFEEQEIDKIVPFFVSRKLTKHAYFAAEGTPCTEVALVKSGILRSYYTIQHAEEITYCFRFPNDLMASYSSFITGNPSLESIQAIGAVELFVIKKNKIEELAKDNSAWLKFLKLIAEQQYMELERRVFQLQKETASERYAYLLKNHANYIQNIPLNYIASYLGISQRHLSRIRAGIQL